MSLEKTGPAPLTTFINHVVESRLLDIALIVSFLFFTALGILATMGYLNAIGTTNAAYLAYASYSLAALSVIALLVKWAVKCLCKPKQEGESASSDPIEKVSIGKIQEDAKAYVRMMTSTNNENKHAIQEQIFKVVRSNEFQQSRRACLTNWKSEIKNIQDPKKRKIHDAAYSFFDVYYKPGALHRLTNLL